jgi:hypothetical protein
MLKRGENSSIIIVVKTKTKGAKDEMAGMNTMMAGMAIQQIFQPLIDGAQQATEHFFTFDDAMRRVNQEAGLSNNTFLNYEKQILNLSSSTGIASDELANGLYNIMATGSVDAAGDYPCRRAR